MTHHPPIIYGELLALAPVAVPAGSRPDGPLVRDLAAWIVMPTYSGDAVHGPYPFLELGALVSATADLSLDDPLAPDTLDTMASAYRGIPVVVLATGRHESPFVVLFGAMLPTAWSPPGP